MKSWRMAVSCAAAAMLMACSLAGCAVGTSPTAAAQKHFEDSGRGVVVGPDGPQAVAYTQEWKDLLGLSQWKELRGTEKQQLQTLLGRTEAAYAEISFGGLLTLKLSLEQDGAAIYSGDDPSLAWVTPAFYQVPADTVQRLLAYGDAHNLLDQQTAMTRLAEKEQVRVTVSQQPPATVPVNAALIESLQAPAWVATGFATELPAGAALVEMALDDGYSLYLSETDAFAYLCVTGGEGGRGVACYTLPDGVMQQVETLCEQTGTPAA